jgi:hypothetical protein
MASRADVVMAQFDTNAAAEERKMQKRIENSKTIRNIDNITATAEGARMGLEMGRTVSDIHKGMKGFKFRRDIRRKNIDSGMESGMSRREARKFWRETGKAEAKAFYKKIEDDGLSHNTMVSMYLDGVNDDPSGDNPKAPTNASNYPDFVGPSPSGQGFVGPVQGSSTTEEPSYPMMGPGSAAGRGYFFSKGIANSIGYLKDRFGKKDDE